MSPLLNSAVHYLRWNWHGFLSVVSGFLCLALGLIVYYKDSQSRVNRTFFLFTLSSFVWIVSYGMLSLVRDVQNGMLWARCGYLYGVSYIPLNTYLFSLAVTRKNAPKLFIRAAQIWAFIAMFTMSGFSPSITLIPEFGWGRYVAWKRTWPGITHQIFVLIPFWILAVASFLNFFGGWKNAATRPEKIQMKYITIGFLAAYLGAVDFLTASHFLVYPSGYITLTFFICAVAYTIVRHRTFNIKLALRRVSLAIAIYSVLFVIGFPASFPLTKALLAQSNRNPAELFLGMATIFGIWFSLGPLIYARFVRSAFWLKGHSAAGLAHEMKSPLSAIISASEFVGNALEQPDLDRKSMTEYNQIISRNASRLNSFVKDLLSVAREESTDLQLERTQIEIAVVLSPVIEQYQPVFQQKGIDFESHLVDALVEVDVARIQQVASNLFSNALKFTDSGKVQLLCQMNGREVSISVIDTGKGIPTKYLEKIFSRFYQVSPNTRGTGIGLTIAKTWVEAHGGKIWAESEGEGKRTTVTFTLPAVER